MDEEEKLIKIYEKAQDSAEHHDHLLWISTSVFLAGSLALIGLILSNFSYLANFTIQISTDYALREINIIHIISILNIILLCGFAYFIDTFRKVYKKKYEICDKIETKILGEKLKEYKHHGEAVPKTHQMCVMWIILATLIIWWILILILS